MSILNNGLSRFLISGSGLGATSARALRITIFVFLLGFIVLYQIILFFVRLFRKPKAGGEGA